MKHIIHRGKVGANGFPLSGKGKERWLEQERKSTFSGLCRTLCIQRKHSCLFVYCCNDTFNVVIDNISTFDSVCIEALSLLAVCVIWIGFKADVTMTHRDLLV